MDIPDDEPILGKVDGVRRFCEQFKIRLIPALTEQGDLNTPRLLRSEVKGLRTLEDVRQEISQGEKGNCEFKSSLQYHFDRAEKDPKARLSDLTSENVLHAALRTIGAFLNSRGGVLYIGVRDNGAILGLEYDLKLPKIRDLDGWQLTLRNQITQRFRDGTSVNDYVWVDLIPLDGKVIARIEVTARNTLSFVTNPDGSGFCLYRRQGNRTTEVRIEEFQEFLAARKKTN